MSLTPRDEQEKKDEKLVGKLLKGDDGGEIIKFPGETREVTLEVKPQEPKKLKPPAMEFKCVHGVLWSWAPVAGAWRTDRLTDMASHPCKCDFEDPTAGLPRRAKPPKPQYTVEVPKVDEKGKPRPFEAHHGGMKDRERLKEVQRLIKRLPTIPGGFPCKEACGKCCETPVEMLLVEWEHLSARPGPNKILDKRTAEGKHIFVERRTPHTVRVQMKEQPNQVAQGVCPFLDGATKKCGIFDERPFVCRAYGQHWFFRCKEGVECPPGLELDDKVVRQWSILAAKEFANRPPEAWDRLREIVVEWRKEKPLERADRLPTYEEIADRYRAPEPTVIHVEPRPETTHVCAKGGVCEYLEGSDYCAKCGLIR